MPVPPVMSEKETEKKREALREAEKKKLEELKDKRKAEFEKYKEEIGKRKQEFQKRLQEIRDTKKKEIVAKANEKMNRVNARRVEEWKKTLARLAQYLGQVQNKAAKLKSNGKDTTGVDSAIVKAQAAIDEATAAVNTQGTKDYTLSIGTELTLKNVIGQAISAEQSDLKTIQQSVDTAKKAVAAAVSALRQTGAK